MPNSISKANVMPTSNVNIFAKLRADIIACRLKPNEHLRVEILRERYKTGASPIREALMRLEAEGLVTLEQNKGFKVPRVSHEVLTDLMRTRLEIEEIALRWSLENGGVEWEANLLSTFHRLSRQSKIDPSRPRTISESWRKEHLNFHAALVSACNSAALLAICMRLFEQSERYVAASILSNVLPRDDTAEHRQLMRAALNRDLNKTCELNRTHISRTMNKVAASLAGYKSAADL